MTETLFCSICGSKRKDAQAPDANQNLCPECGKKTFYVHDLSYITCVENGMGEYEFFFISYVPRRIPDTWVEIWADEEQYSKLVLHLTQDPEVTVTKNDSETSDFSYIRNGYPFRLSYVPYVDYLTDPWWDGDPFIEFMFAQKSHPDYKIYHDELQKIVLLMKE